MNLHALAEHKCTVKTSPINPKNVLHKTAFSALLSCKLLFCFKADLVLEFRVLNHYIFFKNGRFLINWDSLFVVVCFHFSLSLR